ncbi:hypothetical protein Tco_0279534, partial [Tanacetum coccineum]
LNELRDQAYENSLIYKEKTKRIHDAKFKNRVIKVGERVIRRDPKQALRGRHPMLISSMISRIVKTLVLAVFHMSFTSSASVWESSIQI